jgi:hypothetical protein
MCAWDPRPLFATGAGFGSRRLGVRESVLVDVLDGDEGFDACRGCLGKGF